MFRCRDLMMLPSMAEAKLISGQGGLDRLIRWVYKPEDMHFAKWVRGNELLIISVPVIKSRDFDLRKLLNQAVKLRMAGMLLLVGEKYITQIPADVISCSNIKRFPIFCISGEIPLIDIFEEIGHAIAYDDEKEFENSGLFTNIIFGNAVNADAFLSKCRETGYEIDTPQRMFIIRLNSLEKMQMFDCGNVISKIKECFEEAGIPVLLSGFGSSCIGCFGIEKGAYSAVKAVYKKVSEWISEEYENWNAGMGIGKAYTEIEDFHKSYEEASKCIRVIEKTGDGQGIYQFEEIGLYNLILESGDKQIIDEFIENTLGAVLEYDKENHTAFLQTLTSYLWNNNSLLYASRELHMHRNTVKYRIGRIEELTGRSLEDAATKLEFMNAILFMKLCR